MVSTTLRYLVVLLVLAPWAPALRADDAKTESVLQTLYMSDFEPGARYEEWAAELVALITTLSASGDRADAPLASLAYEKLLDIYGSCADPEPFDRFFETFPDLETTSGMIAARARVTQREVLLKQGRYDEAAALGVFAPYGRHFLVAGPFGFQTRSLHHVPFPPESELDLSAVHEGYGVGVCWKALRRDDASPQFSPFDFVFPRAGCCYLLYQFKLPEATRALIYFWNEGSAKIWFNDAEVLDWDRTRTTFPINELIPIAPAAGWNRILVKLSTGRSTAALALLDRNAQAIEGLEECTDFVLHPVAGQPAGRDSEFDPATVNAVPFLENFVDGHQETVAGRIALADALKRKRLLSRAVHAAEAACLVDPRNPHVTHFLGRLYLRAGHLPENIRNNHSHGMLAKTVELRPDFLPARLQLARREHRNDRSEEALGLINAIVDENPGYYGAHRLLATVYDALGWWKEHRDAIDKMQALAPRRDAPIDDLAKHYEALGRHDLALGAYVRILEINAARTDIMNTVADIYWNQGKHEESLRLLSRIDAQQTGAGTVQKMAARHEALGDRPKARALLEALCDRYDGVPSYMVDLADFLLEGGDRADAIDLYKRALAIAPDLHHVRSLLGELGEERGRDPIFEEFKVDGKNFMKNLPGKAEFPKASSILALDHQVTRIYPDGSSLMRIHQVVKVLDKDAVEEYGRRQLPGQIEIVRTILPDGRILEPVDAERSGTFNMPGVDVGCLVETCFTIRERSWRGSPRELGNFYFQDVDGLQPFLFSRSVTVLPKSMEIDEEFKVPELVEREVRDEGKDLVYIYTARNTPVVEKEIFMPPDVEAYPNANFVQYRDWVELAQIMANIHFPDVIVTEEIRQKAATLTAEIDGDLDKARALYSFVNTLVKDDEGSDKATAVLLEGRGDRGVLFMALLDAAGVGYDYLRCGLNPGYLAVPRDWSKVDINLLPQQLIRLHAGPWGEGTLVSTFSRMTPFGEIPPYLFNARAMKVTGVPEPLETLPGGDFETAAREIDLSIDVTLEGDNARITGTLVFPGFGRSNLQEQMRRLDTRQQRQVFERNLLRHIVPGASVIDLDIAGIDEVGSLPTFSFELMARRFVVPIGNQKMCRLLPSPPLFTRRFIRKPDRQFPMIRRGYSSQRFAMTVDLGEGYTLERLPETVVDEGVFVNYALTTAPTEKGFRVEQKVNFIPGDLAPDDYSKLIEAFSAIDERTMEPVILAPVK